MNVPRQTFRERRGILIIFFASLFILYLPKLFKSKPQPLDQESVDKVHRAIQRADSLSQLWKYLPIKINFIKADSLQKLGLYPSLSKRIITYRDKSGGFSDKGDMVNIYGLQDSVLAQMDLNFVGFVGRPKFKKFEPYKKKYVSKRKREIKGVEVKINFINADSLYWIGLPRYMANTIIKYRNRIKNYNDRSDLLKVYGIDTSLIDKLNINYDLRPIDKFNDNLRDSSDYVRTTMAKDSVTFYPDVYIDMNTANEEELIKIYGIGPAFAKRILARREYFGGFYTIEQIKYTPKVHPDAIEALKGHIHFTTPPRPFVIDSSNLEWLIKHPYLSENQVNQLMILYKDDVLTKDEVINSKVFSKWEWERVKYYF